MYKLLAIATLAALLSACSPMRSVQVQPASTAMDDEALRAGELRIAHSALASGDLDVALSLFQRVTAAHPGNADSWLGLGTAHFLGGDFAQARVAYEQAITLDAEQIDAHLGLARMDIHQRRLTEAETRYQAMLARWPDHPVVLAGLGTTYDLMGRSGDAQTVYRRGLAAHPGDPALRSNLGLSLALNGKPREAVNVLLDVVGVPKSLPQGRQNLALAYALMGREDAAESILIADMPRESVQDNLAYYRYVRTRMQTGG